MTQTEGSKSHLQLLKFPAEGPAKCFFHRPCWEIFAMVSIQIWVTRFHIHCTGELEQVCLALVTGCPFLSTELGKQHHKQLATTRDAFVHS